MTRSPGFQADWDVAIPMDDGVVLRANVFRPADGRPVPALLSYGPYGKDLPFQAKFPKRWEIVERHYPDVLANSTNGFQCWELPDPEKWVPEGYAVVRVDARGAGRSPGRLDNWSMRERLDAASCVEWAAAAWWCTGKVGMVGVSYHAMIAWQVAALDPAPPSLAAICCWEGCSDLYREAAYHGGIHDRYLQGWFGRVCEVQHGAANPARNPVSGLAVTGDDGLAVTGDKTTEPGELARTRQDIGADILAHPLIDEYWEAREVDLKAVTVPVLSAGNWGGHGMHLRGNVQGYLECSSREAWLEIHGKEHWSLFMADHGRELQRAFFDYYLKGEGDWAATQPRVQLAVRQVDDTFVTRAESEWPLARTEWTRYYLDAASSALGPAQPPPAQISYLPFESGVTFLSDPFPADIEITGPVAAKVWVSSATTDTDIFLVLHAYDPGGREVLFTGASDPFVPMAQGWLRASHRALDPRRSVPWRPVHPHRRTQPLVPGEIYELDVEIWPTCLALPAGYRLGLSVQGKDFDHGLTDDEMAATGKPVWSTPPTRGCGPHLHDVPSARPADIYGGKVTIHTGGDHPSYVLLPVVPPR